MHGAIQTLVSLWVSELVTSQPKLAPQYDDIKSMDTIVDPRRDFEGINFGDKRLNDRLIESVGRMTERPQQSALGSGEGRANAKGFYRLLSNPKFNLNILQEQEKEATIERMKGHDTVLLVQDTSDVGMNTHKKTEGLGYCSEHILGVKLHTCIAFTTEGIPLGVMGQRYETRAEAKTGISKYELGIRPIEEKESYRWIEMLEDSTKDIPEGIDVITVTDREGDFYELYAKASELRQRYIIRIIHNRKTATGEKLIDKVKEAEGIGLFSVDIPRDTRNNKRARTALMEVAFCDADMLRPVIRNEPHLPETINTNIIRISEVNAGSEAVEWILATNIKVETAEECKQIVEYYVQRWKIERFHFVLKSGCNVEKIQQRTYEKLKAVLFIYSVIALYIMAMTFMGRMASEAPCDLFFSEIEWKTLYCLGKKQEFLQSSHTV